MVDELLHRKLKIEQHALGWTHVLRWD